MFTFSKIEEDNRTQNRSEERLLADPGNIDVFVFRCKIASHYPTHPPRRSATNHIFTQADVKGKAISHQIKLGQTMVCAPRPLFDVEYLDPHRFYFARSTFRYRSLRDLKTIGFVPRTPSPEPLCE
jgi:hypothetical protein